MTQGERRIWLIRYLLREQIRYREITIPADAEGQRRLLQSLLNVRQPRPVSEEFLLIQDAYLKERNRERGIIEGDSLPSVPADERISVWQGDITTLRCDTA